MAREKRILVLLSDLSTGRQYEDLIDSLLGQGFHVEVVFWGDSDAKIWNDLCKIAAKKYEVSRVDLGKKPFFPIVRKLKNRPNRVFISGWSIARTALPLTKIFFVSKSVYVRHHGSLHESEQLTRKQKFKAQLLDRLLQFLANTVVAVSHSHAQYIIAKGCESEKVKVVLNSFENSSRIQSNTHPATSYSNQITQGLTFRIAIVSRFTHWKGVHFATEAICNLSRRFIGLELVLVGERADSWSLIQQTLSSSSTLPWKHLDYVEDMSNFYNSIHCLVHTPVGPHDESFGQVILETLIARKPLVTTLSGFILDDMEAKEASYIVNKYKDSTSIERTLEQLLLDSLPKVLSIEKTAVLRERYSLEKTRNSYLEALA